MIDGYNFSSIMLTFPYQNFAIKNTNVTSKAYVGDSGSKLCSIVTPISISIHPDVSTKYWVLPKTFVALTFTTPRNASMVKCLHCKERMGISHHLLFILRGERIVD